MSVRSLRAPLAAVAFVIAGLSCTSPSEPPEPSQLLLSVANVSLDAIGATRAVTATVRDQRGKVMPNVTGILWASNGTSVATVSGAGLVTATGNGAAQVTATLGTLIATANVSVQQIPVAPVIVSGNFQTATVATTLAESLVVRVGDRLGVPMAGVPVGFAVTSGGGAVGSTGAVSGAAGLAATTWTLGNSTAPLQRVSASAAGAAATTTFAATAVAGPATAMLIAPDNTADGQVGNIAQAVPVRPAVILRDVIGNPVVGATVTFAVTAGGGSVTGGAAVTDNAGIATVGSWTLGASEGVNTLTASHAALTPIVFTANGVADRCSPPGAQPITVGVTVASTLSMTDCPGTFADGPARFEYYRLTLNARTAIAVDMSAQFDTWVSILNATTLAVIAENDDIIRATITDSRTGITLDSGSYLIRARGFDEAELGDYTLLARPAIVGAPGRLIPNSANGLVAAPGAATSAPPSVLVLDEVGDPVAGVTVTFATVGGVGSIAGASAVTGANGIATAGSWTLADGANVVTATVSGGNAVISNPTVFSAKGTANSAGFGINLRFATVPTPTQLAAFSTAAARWESIITGDLPAQPVNFQVGDCASSWPMNESIDDVNIIVSLEPIDGAGQVLGSAGPCVTRAGTVLPAMGRMQFDVADLANLEAGGALGAVILHEMGHVIGVGTIWGNKGFLQLPSPTSGPGPDTHFNGANAIAAFNSLGGSAYPGAKVPVENSQGGSGTRNSHWRESVLDHELMTGFLDGGVANPLSILTVQSLRDLGYVVSNAGADNYTVPAGLRQEGETNPLGRFHLKDDIWRGPVVMVDRSGRPVGPVRLPKRVKPVR